MSVSCLAISCLLRSIDPSAINEMDALESPSLEKHVRASRWT